MRLSDFTGDDCPERVYIIFGDTEVIKVFAKYEDAVNWLKDQFPHRKPKGKKKEYCNVFYKKHHHYFVYIKGYDLEDEYTTDEEMDELYYAD
jgi:hypothetical protein